VLQDLKIHTGLYSIQLEENKSMEVTQTQKEGVFVLGLKGRLDSNTSDDFEKKLLGLILAGETRLVLDFKDLDYISSAGLRVLLKAAKELKRNNGRLAFCSLKDYIREIFELSGFVTFFPIHATLEESLKAL
jgi:anti-sigma B factor antagonist